LDVEGDVHRREVDQRASSHQSGQRAGAAAAPQPDARRQHAKRHPAVGNGKGVLERAVPVIRQHAHIAGDEVVGPVSQRDDGAEDEKHCEDFPWTLSIAAYASVKNGTGAPPSDGFHTSFAGASIAIFLKSQSTRLVRTRGPSANST